MATYTTNEAYVEDLELIKTDKNGSKHYVDHKCPKCNGTGFIPCYSYYEAGVCFKCGGSGKFDSITVLRTKEYAAKLEARRDERLRKQAPAHNADFLKQNGFNESGETFVVLGKTFDIKDELKLRGAKFDKVRGWHFNEIVNGYDLAKFTSDEILFKSLHGSILGFNDNAESIIKEVQDDYEAKHAVETNFFGSIGDKIERKVRCVASFCFAGYYGDSYLNKLIDEEGNVFVWKTGRALNGATAIIKGTIKEHNEYNGEKQTILTRCKIVES